MKTDLYRVIRGDDIITPSEDSLEPIVEGMMYKRDYMLLVSEEKQGKTILSQQLACCLSGGQSFLQIFDIPKPIKVWYFVTEGRVEDLKDRFKRISNKVGVNTDNIILIPTFFRFNTKEGIEALGRICEELKDEPPELVIIDSLYRTIQGSIAKDDVVNDFHFVMQKLSENLQCAILLVHHMTKPSKNSQGKYFNRTDKDSFGSAFLSAGVDHIFWIEPNRKGRKYEKVLRCDTQRSGLIMETLRIRLMRNDPLFFEPIQKYEEDEKKIVNVLKNKADGMHFEELSKHTGITDRSKMYVILKYLQVNGLLVKFGTKPKYYKLNKLAFGKKESC